MKSFVFCFLSFVLALSLPAQESRQGGGLLGRMRRPGSATAAQPTAPTPASTAAAQAPGASTDAGGRSIEFNGAPVDMVFAVYQDLKQKTVLKDPQTPAATITLQPQKGQELSVEEKIEAIETVLEMNGIHMEPYGEKFMRAIPRKDARKDGIPLIMDPDHELGESTRVVSLMIPFKNIAVDEAQKALEGFKSNSGILLVFERTNKILVTDTEQIINRMREIAREIDKASEVTEVVEYIQIKYASANDIKQVIDSIVQESMKEQEKNGKAPANQSQNGSGLNRANGLLGLRRPGQPNQPTAPANNESLVMTVSDADRGMIRGKVVTIADERSNKILIITNASNMKFFKDVIAALDVETTPDTVVKVYRLKYAEAEDVSDMINDLIGSSTSSKSGGKSNQNQAAKTGTSGSVTSGRQQAAKKPANQRTGEAQAGELNKENTTVLADKRINGLVVMTNKELVPTVEQIIESMDIKLSQVLIETCIIEVTLGDELKTGVDWIQNGRFQNDGSWATQAKVGEHGLPVYWYKSDKGEWKQAEEGTLDDDESTWTKMGDALTETVWKAGDLSKGAAAGYFTGNPGFAQAMSGGANNGSQALSVLSGASNVVGSALNYVFKSDKLNLSAVIQATKTDSRAKYIASPVVMTVDNKEATIEATQARKFLTNYQTSSSYYGSTPAPQYENKDIGIKIKVTPKINPNGTVMLNVEEEYSQVGAKQTILDPNSQNVSIDTSLTRKMSADALLENMQTVILCGLTETSTMESESGIPILKDIPIIGKWLFGKVEQSEGRSELIIFMTPYVLNDAESAQAEAIRRKRVLSDPRAWDDHGWSASALADPVSKKEQMRRLKDEWRKQDEERKARMEIEQEKVKRAEKLKEMSVEERAQWLLMHKEELEEEKQEELEKKMQDKDSQEELKKLAAEIREKKLGEAEKELKKAEEETKADNERAKLDAEKKAKAEPEAEKK